jgi:hypothetical protein
MINLHQRISLLFFLLSLLIILFPTNLSARQNTFPFKSGERLHYKVSYNWQFVWVEAGKVTFEVDSLQNNYPPAYHFKSFGKSLSTYDWLFKVRDNFQSVADAENFKPYWYKRNTREGDYWVDNRLDFDYTNNRIIAKTENTHRGITIDTLALNGFVMDLQTAVYYARSLDFNAMKVDEKISFNVIIDGEFYELFVRYRGIEVIENYDGQIYRCHKFSALLVEGTIFKGGEDLSVWVTDDNNHIPILVEAKILVGSVKAYFTKGENIKHPMESVIE